MIVVSEEFLELVEKNPGGFIITCVVVGAFLIGITELIDIACSGKKGK